MTDARRRLRLVTEAAYGNDAATVGQDAVAPAVVAPGTDPGDRSLDTGSTAGAGVPVAHGPPPEHTSGNRWGTPALLAVRVGVAVLVLAVAAAVAIVVTRPSAPAHQPELAWPAPPAEWDGGVSADGGNGAPGQDDASNQAGVAEVAEVAEEGDVGGQGGAVATQVVVHVAGAVHSPGIVDVAEDARVHEVILAAGGATDEADLAALNLAAPVQDGQQVYVPVHGEDPRPAPADAGPGTDGPPLADGPTGAVDLNTATGADLQTLPGIGPAMADRILAHRDEHGPFGSVDDLLAVSGIGPATLERLRDQVSV